MDFIYGFSLAFVLLGALTALSTWIGSARTSADERKAIREFCEDRDYCFYGCGKYREGAYYGGYRCQSDHK